MQSEMKIMLIAFIILYSVLMIVTAKRILEAVDKNIKTQVKYFDNKKVNKDAKTKLNR